MPLRPNIVLVLIDTLRADRLSCYGHGRTTSPAIDRIAAGGVVYEQAVSAAPWTVPSHASLFTGTYPSRHGVTRSQLVLGTDLVPLPEALRLHGYRTYGVSSNYWLSRETGFDRGFDRFAHSWQLVQTAGDNAALARQHRKHALGIDGAAASAGAPRGLRGACARAINGAFDRATRALRRSLHRYDDGAWRVNHVVGRWMSEWQRLDAPFFAFVHYMEPHLRYMAPGRYRRMHVPAAVSDARLDGVNQDPWRHLTGRAPMSGEDFDLLGALYDGEVSYVDARVGQLHDAMAASGLLRNTLFIVTSDHGDNLGEHQLMDHAYCLYDTLLRVPLIVTGLRDFPRGTRVTEPVQTLDLFPTLLELAEAAGDGVAGQAQGAPLFPVSGRAPATRPMVAEYLEPQPPVEVLRRRYPGWDGSPYDRTLRALRAGPYKYIWGSDGRCELYDVVRDPGETRDLAAIEPARVAELRATLDGWVSSFDHATASDETLELDEVTRKRLEELGYLA